MTLKFDYVVLVKNRKEAEFIAKDMGLKRDDFKYCSRMQDIMGVRFPNSRLFFIDDELDTMENRLHSRFEDIRLFNQVTGKFIKYELLKY